jgi:hypothetical protein
MTTRNPEPLPAVAPAKEGETFSRRSPEGEGGRNSRRSRKIYILWAIALTLLLSLGAFCWLVVVPVTQLRNAECGVRNGPQALYARSSIRSPQFGEPLPSFPV